MGQTNHVQDSGCYPTIKFPVGNWCNRDATSEHRAVREKKEGGNKSSIGLEGRGFIAKYVVTLNIFLYVNTLPSHKLQFYCGQHKVAGAGIWKVKQQKT